MKDHPAHTLTPKQFRTSRLIWGGVVLLLIGTGPLLAIILLAKLGLTKDPDPNPVLFGIMALFTFYPSIGLIAAGIISVRKHNRKLADKASDVVG